jgi:hypothetical protein
MCKQEASHFESTAAERMQLLGHFGVQCYRFSNSNTHETTVPTVMPTSHLHVLAVQTRSAATDDPANHVYAYAVGAYSTLSQTGMTDINVSAGLQCMVAAVSHQTMHPQAHTQQTNAQT